MLHWGKIYKLYTKTTIEGVHTTAGMIFKYAIKEKMRVDNPKILKMIQLKINIWSMGS